MVGATSGLQTLNGSTLADLSLLIGPNWITSGLPTHQEKQTYPMTVIGVYRQYQRAFISLRLPVSPQWPSAKRRAHPATERVSPLRERRR